MFPNVEQMKRFSILLITIISLNSCKTRTTNQTINKKREGLWIEKYAIDSAQYKSIGKYKKDDPIKKWKYYLNGKLIKKECHHKKFCQTKFYHENGEIQSQGKTRLDLSTKYAHWFYSGNWNFYDDKGKLIMKRNYDKGKLLSEIILK